MKSSILFILVLLICIPPAKSQDIRLNIINMMITADHDSMPGRDNHIVINNTWRQSGKVHLFSGMGASIDAKYRIKTYRGVRRSNTKKSEISVRAKYKIHYMGKKRKIVTEHLYFKMDDKKFDEEQTVYFYRGLNNIPFKIRYSFSVESR